MPRGYRDAERFRVQGLNDIMVFGSQATAALSAGAILSWLGWGGLVMVAVPFLILHGLLMTLWLLRERAPEPAVNGRD